MGIGKRAVLMLLSLVLAAQLYALWKKAAMDRRGEKEYQQVRGEALGTHERADGEEDGPFRPDTEKLRKLNEEYGAWLWIPGTSVDYPVTRPADNRRYLSKTFLGEENACGCLFFEASCIPGRSMNTVIHGHNMRSGAMFGTLKRYLDQEYAGSRGRICLYIGEGWREYEIFSVYLTGETDIQPFQSQFASKEAYREYMDSRKARSLYEWEGVQPFSGKQPMVTLSTCHGRGRKLIIHALERGDDEKGVGEGIGCRKGQSVLGSAPSRRISIGSPA